jgi:transcriptional regulator with XRE-family HTH domain
MFFFHDAMRSFQKTPVAIIRQEIGLSAEAFAELIGKSVSTVTKLETAILKLSEETAYRLSEETGASMQWFLEGDPEAKPYWIDPVDNRRRPWMKQIFELTQSAKEVRIGKKRHPAWHLKNGIDALSDLLSVYLAATEAGREELALYLIEQCSKKLVERLGKDDKAFLRINQKAHLTTANGLQWRFRSTDGRISLEQIPEP